MRVAVVDYGSGNLRSVAKAFERAAREADVAAEIAVTAEPDMVAAADRIVLPGVGAFADCRAGLGGVPGMIDALETAVVAGGRPFLGICVGMQLMAREGREHGVTPGLDWLPGRVEVLRPADPALKVPHMGWNDLQTSDAGRRHPVLAGIAPGAHGYFVHSYHLVTDNPATLLATAEYGGPVTAAVGRDNMVGTQFHPEKSQATGLDLIRRFLAWRP